jgi:dTDP-4-amino-4,6-dideoxygalactose transaminase
MEKISFSKPMICLDEEDYRDIKKVIDSGWVSIGQHMERLETRFRERFDVKHAIACSCCTQGLTIALKAAGWRNKRIAVPAFTWPSTIYAIESNIGNTPVFCDIDRRTWLIDLDNIEEDSYDAVIAVDTFGNQANVRTNKPLIYDAAHGFDLDNLGHRGIAEVVSFSFTKVVSAIEGGMILTNDDEIAETAYELRRLSARMSEINAIIALKSLEKYDDNQQRKLNIIQKYKNSFDFDFTLQQIPSCTNYSVFSILLDTTIDRDIIAQAFRENNIEVKIYYEPLVKGLPRTDWVYSHIISLPIYPEIAAKQEFILDLINKNIKNKSKNAGAVINSIHTPGKTYLEESGYLKNYLRKEVKRQKIKRHLPKSLQPAEQV